MSGRCWTELRRPSLRLLAGGMKEMDSTHQVSVTFVSPSCRSGSNPRCLASSRAMYLPGKTITRGESHSGHSALMGKVKCELEMISGSVLMEMTSIPRWLIFWARIRESSTILPGGATRIVGKPIRRDHLNGIVHDLSVLLSLRSSSPKIDSSLSYSVGYCCPNSNVVILLPFSPGQSVPRKSNVQLFQQSSICSRMLTAGLESMTSIPST